MNGILKYLHDWSKDLPNWQSDALRQVLENGSIPPEGILELAKMAAPGAFPNEEPREALPLAQSAASSLELAESEVILTEISEAANVNAISSTTPLRFATDGLTAIYGDNGAGKSGYTRILKKICAAKDTNESIWNDARIQTPRSPARAKVTYVVNGEIKSDYWENDKPFDECLKAMSVFDSRCAKIYINAEHNIAYLPFGLSAPEALAKTCGAVKQRLDSLAAQINISTGTLSDIDQDTKIGKLLTTLLKGASCGPLLKEHANVNPADIVRHQELKEALAEADPAAKARQLTAIIRELTTAQQKSDRLYRVFSDEKINNLQRLAGNLADAKLAAEAAAKILDSEGPALPGTGTAGSWKLLFDAAQSYSQEFPHNHGHFPNLPEGSPCPLCQQPLSDKASKRIESFQQFLANEAALNLEKALLEQIAAKEFLVSSDNRSALASSILLEAIDSYDPGLKSTLEQEAQLRALEFDKIIKSLNTGHWDTFDFPISPSLALNNLIVRLTGLVEELNNLANGTRAQQELEFKEIDAAIKLSNNQDALDQLISSLTRKHALTKASKAINTRPISNMIGTILRKAVTPELEQAISSEMANLRIDGHTISLSSSAPKGRPIQSLSLALPSQAPTAEILSEGEQRTLAIAYFLAEASVNPTSTGIIFDDPVSSLDHARREEIARRLVELSQSRQVIVFTHDLYFLQLLEEGCKVREAAFSPRYLRWANNNPGQVEEDHPFAGLTAAKRIKSLNASIQQAAAANRRGDEIFNILAENCFKLIRETWERAIEEVLLNGTIQRFSKNISPDRLAVVDIEPEDKAMIIEGHIQCNYFVHDRPMAGGPRIPKVEDLEREINRLSDFVAIINDRRSAQKAALKLRNANQST
ncbi:MAG: AAA family ATPase [Zhongshania sp.]|nr:AAA family ATPase [Zhongshania sp.]